MQQRPRPNNDSRSIANAAVQNQKSESTGGHSRSRYWAQAYRFGLRTRRTPVLGDLDAGQEKGPGDGET
jgi:hypothetical protein